MAPFGDIRIMRKVIDGKRPGADDTHVAPDDIDKLRQLVYAAGTQEFTEFCQPLTVRKQLSVFIHRICHAAKFNQIENFFISARARLTEDNRASEFYPDQYGKHCDQRAEYQKRQRRSDQIQYTFYIIPVYPSGFFICRLHGSFPVLHLSVVHHTKHLWIISITLSCCCAVILLSLGRQSPLSNSFLPRSTVSPSSRYALDRPLHMP